MFYDAVYNTAKLVQCNMDGWVPDLAVAVFIIIGFISATTHDSVFKNFPIVRKIMENFARVIVTVIIASLGCRFGICNN